MLAEELPHSFNDDLPVEVVDVEILQFEKSNGVVSAECRVTARDTASEYTAYYSAMIDHKANEPPHFSPICEDMWSAEYLESGVVTRELASRFFDCSGLR